MRNVLFALMLILLSIEFTSAQSLKKPHQFLIPKGATIQHHILSKPKYVPTKLASRAFGYFNPQYHSISQDVFNKLRTDIHVLNADNDGIPSRFTCTAIPENSNQTQAEYWKANLIEKLKLSPASNIQFNLKHNETDNTGITHLKYDQLFDGAPVINAEYFVHIFKDHTVLAHGLFLQPSQALNASINKEQAYLFAKQYLKSKGINCIEPHANQAKWIKTGLQSSVLGYWQNNADQSWHLVYLLDIFPNATSRWELTVDAVSGQILKSLKNQCMFDFMNEHCNSDNTICYPDPQSAEKTTAQDLFNITRTIDVWRDAGVVYLIDASRPMFNASAFKLDDPVGAIWTIDANFTNPNNLQVDHIKSTANTWPKNGVSAHYNAGIAFEYYKNTHQRNSINGQGGTIISVINVNDESGGGLDNAFWNGEAMFYGNGATAFNSLARGLDVGGHEMSHGVIQSTANLAYEDESGAINESFADVFGAMIERKNWTIGEDVVKLNVFPSGALRDMSDPHNGATPNDLGRWQPKHVNEKYTGTQDNGGVHINSGIPNYAFYLFVQEIAKSGTEEQAKQTAEKVYYKALSQYLTRSSNFKDLRAAVEQSCIDLFGNNSSVLNAAKKAFDAVGIGSSGSSGGGNYQKDLPVNPGKEFVVCTNKDNVGVYLIDVSKGTFITLSNQTIKSKPSVTDDGTEIYFVGANSELYGLYFKAATQQYEEVLLDDIPVYRNATISKDGALLSVLYEQEENKINIYQFSTKVWNEFILTNPTTSSGVATSNVRYADFMDFEPSGQYLMYDCLSKLDRNGGGTYEYWDIGFLRVWDLVANSWGDGHIEKLFANLPDNTSVGNPVYSKNSPYIMAFDYFEENLFGNSYSVLAANIETGDVGEIAINRDDLGYPSYSVHDDYMLYNGFDNNQQICLKVVPLNTNKIQSNGNEAIFFGSARWGNWFANGKRSLVNTSNEKEESGIVISPNPFNSAFTVKMVSKSNQTLHYELFNNTGQSLGSATKYLLSGINSFDIDMNTVPSGIYYIKFISQEGESGMILSKIGR